MLNVCCSFNSELYCANYNSQAKQLNISNYWLIPPQILILDTLFCCEWVLYHSTYEFVAIKIQIYFRSTRMISQHWLGRWLGAVRQQTTWVNVDHILWRYMTSLDRNLSMNSLWVRALDVSLGLSYEIRVIIAIADLFKSFVTVLYTELIPYDKELIINI